MIVLNVSGAPAVDIAGALPSSSQSASRVPAQTGGGPPAWLDAAKSVQGSELYSAWETAQKNLERLSASADKEGARRAAQDAWTRLRADAGYARFEMLYAAEQARASRAASARLPAARQAEAKWLRDQATVFDAARAEAQARLSMIEAAGRFDAVPQSDALAARQASLQAQAAKAQEHYNRQEALSQKAQASHQQDLNAATGSGGGFGSGFDLFGLSKSKEQQREDSLPVRSEAAQQAKAERDRAQQELDAFQRELPQDFATAQTAVRETQARWQQAAAALKLAEARSGPAAPGAAGQPAGAGSDLERDALADVAQADVHAALVAHGDPLDPAVQARAFMADPARMAQDWAWHVHRHLGNQTHHLDDEGALRQLVADSQSLRPEFSVPEASAEHARVVDAVVRRLQDEGKALDGPGYRIVVSSYSFAMQSKDHGNGRGNGLLYSLQDEQGRTRAVVDGLVAEGAERADRYDSIDAFVDDNTLPGSDAALAVMEDGRAQVGTDGRIAMRVLTGGAHEEEAFERWTRQNPKLVTGLTVTALVMMTATPFIPVGRGIAAGAAGTVGARAAAPSAGSSAVTALQGSLVGGLTLYGAASFRQMYQQEQARGQSMSADTVMQGVTVVSSLAALTALGGAFTHGVRARATPGGGATAAQIAVWANRVAWSGYVPVARDIHLLASKGAGQGLRAGEEEQLWLNLAMDLVPELAGRAAARAVGGRTPATAATPPALSHAGHPLPASPASMQMPASTTLGATAAGTPGSNGTRARRTDAVSPPAPSTAPARPALRVDQSRALVDTLARLNLSETLSRLAAGQRGRHGNDTGEATAGHAGSTPSSATQRSRVVGATPAPLRVATDGRPHGAAQPVSPSSALRRFVDAHRLPSPSVLEARLEQLALGGSLEAARSELARARARFDALPANVRGEEGGGAKGARQYSEALELLGDYLPRLAQARSWWPATLQGRGSMVETLLTEGTGAARQQWQTARQQVNNWRSLGFEGPLRAELEQVANELPQQFDLIQLDARIARASSIENATGVSRRIEPGSEKAQQIEALRRDAVPTGLGPEVDGILALYPALQQHLKRKLATGLTIRYGDTPDGAAATYDPVSQTTIVSRVSRGPDGKDRVFTPEEIASVVGHELSHDEVPNVGHTADERSYLDAHFREESRACLAQWKLREEVLLRGGPELPAPIPQGIPETRFLDIYARFLESGDLEQATGELAQSMLDNPDHHHAHHYRQQYQSHVAGTPQARRHGTVYDGRTADTPDNPLTETNPRRAPQPVLTTRPLSNAAPGVEGPRGRPPGRAQDPAPPAISSDELAGLGGPEDIEFGPALTTEDAPLSKAIGDLLQAVDEIGNPVIARRVEAAIDRLARQIDEDPQGAVPDDVRRLIEVVTRQEPASGGSPQAPDDSADARPRHTTESPDGTPPDIASPPPLLPRRQRRSPMAEVRFSRSESGHELRASASEFEVHVRVEVPGQEGSPTLTPGPKEEIVVTHIFRGALPPGSGSRLLVDLLQHYGVYPTQRLVIRDVQNVETVLTFEHGGDAARSVLGKTGLRALDAMGIDVSEVSFRGSGRKDLELVFELRRGDAGESPGASGRDESTPQPGSQITSDERPALPRQPTSEIGPSDGPPAVHASSSAGAMRIRRLDGLGLYQLDIPGGFLLGELKDGPNGLQAIIKLVEVDAEHRGTGKGRRLVHGFAEFARRQGATELVGDIAHPAALAIRERLGEGAITLPAGFRSIDELRSYLRRRDELGDDFRSPRVTTDLTHAEVRRRLELESPPVLDAPPVDVEGRLAPTHRFARPRVEFDAPGRSATDIEGWLRRRVDEIERGGVPGELVIGVPRDQLDDLGADPTQRSADDTFVGSLARRILDDLWLDDLELVFVRRSDGSWALVVRIDPRSVTSPPSAEADPSGGPQAPSPRATRERPPLALTGGSGASARSVAEQLHHAKEQLEHLQRLQSASELREVHALASSTLDGADPDIVSQVDGTFLETIDKVELAQRSVSEAQDELFRYVGLLEELRATLPAETTHPHLATPVSGFNAGQRGLIENTQEVLGGTANQLIDQLRAVDIDALREQAGIVQQLLEDAPAHTRLLVQAEDLLQLVQTVAREDKARVDRAEEQLAELHASHDELERLTAAAREQAQQAAAVARQGDALLQQLRESARAARQQSDQAAARYEAAAAAANAAVAQAQQALGAARGGSITPGEYYGAQGRAQELLAEVARIKPLALQAGAHARTAAGRVKPAQEAAARAAKLAAQAAARLSELETMQAGLAPALEEAVAALRPLRAQLQASQAVASDAASHVHAVRQYGGAADASASGALAAMTQARAVSGEAQDGMQLTVELIDGYVTRMMAPGQGTPGTAVRAADRPAGPADEGPAAHGSRAERYFSPDELLPMGEEDRGEEIPVNPHLPWSQPPMRYFSAEERMRFRVEIRPDADGQPRLYDKDGQPLNTFSKLTQRDTRDGRANFVMDEFGQLYSLKREPFMLWSKGHEGGDHEPAGEYDPPTAHSSLLAGRPVATAGEWVVADGVVRFISNFSGHYQPSPQRFQRSLDVLRRMGLDLSSAEIRTWEYDRDAGSHGTGSAQASLLRRADTPAWATPSEAAHPRGDAIPISNVESVAEATRQAIHVLASDATARPLQVFEPSFSRSDAQQLADRTGMPVNVYGRDVTHLPRLVLSNANAALPARDKAGAFEQALQMLKQRGVHASGVLVPHSMLPARRGESDQWLQRAADELGVRVTALDRNGRERALYLPGETPQPVLPGERGLRPLTRHFRPTLAWMARAVQRGFDERFADYRPDSTSPPAARDVFTRNPQRYLDLRYPGGVPDEVLNAHGGVFGARDLWGSVGAFHDRDSGRIVQRRTWSGSISNTVRLRAHEEAHRRQHDAFGMTAGPPLPDGLRDVLHEGGANVVTEIYFGVPRIDGTDYPRSTELMRKVKDRVSEETFLKAYFQGDERANVAVVEALRTEWRAVGRRTVEIDPLAPFRLDSRQGYASS